ncbi:MAG: pseudaminic acid synthase [Candidatus Heimdallarchaeota archaeon]|nr:pseudaminic acid synthase [Candidatus Heimdallarchaeota archaeon]MCK5143697.1 pseudaminic acid synthase [Candidatus Heimdallarchaeota archaeon]
MKEVKIGNRLIGEGHPVFIVAELSANHLQDYDLAVKIVKAAKEAGADAIKLQTYTPDTITLDCDNEYFKLKQGTIWDGKTFYELYQEAYTPWDWQPKLQELANELGLIFFSSPFDQSAVDFLEKLNVPAFKVASFEITDIPLIEYVASKSKPVIISTGIATEEDIQEAIKACERAGNKDIILLKCSSSYPSPLEDINLRNITYLSETFGKLVGLSDHTLGISVPVASVALGACLIEKHLTLDRNQGGPDSAFSLEPTEFEEMVKSIREVEKSLGKEEYTVTTKMEKNKELSRSLFISKDIEKGEILSEENVRSVRPGYGLHPKELKNVLGKKTKDNIKKGTPLSWDLIE